MRTVYGFCREVDDLVDQNRAGREETAKTLSRWAGFVRQGGDAPRPDLGVRLEAAIGRFGIPREHLLEIIEGVRMDLTPARYETFEALKGYCYGVASAVGLSCLPIFGVSIQEGRDYAVNLGLAFQLTNIIRDVSSDADRGRIYLPLEDLRRFGYTEEELFARVYDGRFAALMAFQAGRARGFYQSAEKALSKDIRRRLLPARVMKSVYMGLLNKIERGGFRVFSGKVSLDPFSKWGAVLREVISK